MPGSEKAARHIADYYEDYSLIQEMGLDALIITRGGDGSTLITSAGEQRHPDSRLPAAQEPLGYGR